MLLVRERVLFNLYFKDGKMIAKSHCFSVHSFYADDMQCYFELGKNISINFESNKITSFPLDLCFSTPSLWTHFESADSNESTQGRG